MDEICNTLFSRSGWAGGEEVLPIPARRHPTSRRSGQPWIRRQEEENRSNGRIERGMKDIDIEGIEKKTTHDRRMISICSNDLSNLIDRCVRE